jgi:hypothetical protein
MVSLESRAEGVREGELFKRGTSASLSPRLPALRLRPCSFISLAGKNDNAPDRRQEDFDVCHHIMQLYIGGWREVGAKKTLFLSFFLSLSLFLSLVQ